VRVGDHVPAALVARMLGRDPRTVRAWIRRGTVRGCQVGRHWYVYRSELEWLRGSVSGVSAIGRPI
jgi:excisionase family DNA binding protein